MSNQQTFATDRRRRLRAPYRVSAKLEIIGITPQGAGWPVTTTDAGPWGAHLISPRPLPAPPGTPVTLELPLPGEDRPLRIAGWMIHAAAARAADGDAAAPAAEANIDTDAAACVWEAGVEFDRPQPALAPTLIELAQYRK